ncbi:YceI family protein [Rhodobium gokarnense]|uniref:Polyisoprenoid-binding protein YceI n=1 Tax=Rhodobium gokarnense TaxID=364296 RepID=A0ABT3HGH7_9HYPH|nr:YceI family protein [Rhodobium gokarnense]MCW2309492.1 polyisoprenoid-binding protein YceI [Rhodobium gokarnense]
MIPSSFPLSRVRRLAAAVLVAGSFGAALAGPALAADGWIVDPAKSTVGFTATQAGEPFKGTFKAFQADITFDPNDMNAGNVDVVFDTTQIETGDAQKDANLPTPNWFNAKAHPMATFTASNFSKTGDDSYVAKGELTIRDIAKPVTLPFTLTIDGNTAKMSGETTVKRTDFGIGTGVPVEMIGDDVVVTVSLTATK